MLNQLPAQMAHTANRAMVPPPAKGPVPANLPDSMRIAVPARSRFAGSQPVKNNGLHKPARRFYMKLPL